jgi:hypothetical protein
VRSLPTLTTLSTTAVQTCHNAWPTGDNRFAVTTTERSGGLVRFFDISNPASPLLVSTYRTGASTTIPHNAYFKERVCYMSYYSEGLRCVDLSNPPTPVEVGYYDHSTYTSNFNGAWGGGDPQPSGVCYTSDIQTGLWVMKPKATTQAYGVATPGTGGVAPELRLFGAAYLGNASFRLEVERARPSASTVILLSTQRQNVSFFGLTLLVQTIGVPSLSVSVGADANGKGSVSVPVPNDPGLNGVVLHGQVIAIDPAGPLGLAASRGATFEVFQL